MKTNYFICKSCNESIPYVFQCGCCMKDTYDTQFCRKCDNVDRNSIFLHQKNYQLNLVLCDDCILDETGDIFMKLWSQLNEENDDKKHTCISLYRLQLLIDNHRKKYFGSSRDNFYRLEREMIINIINHK